MANDDSTAASNEDGNYEDNFEPETEDAIFRLECFAHFIEKYAHELFYIRIVNIHEEDTSMAQKIMMSAEEGVLREFAWRANAGWLGSKGYTKPEIDAFIHNEDSRTVARRTSTRSIAKKVQLKRNNKLK